MGLFKRTKVKGNKEIAADKEYQGYLASMKRDVSQQKRSKTYVQWKNMSDYEHRIEKARWQ